MLTECLNWSDLKENKILVACLLQRYDLIKWVKKINSSNLSLKGTFFCTWLEEMWNSSLHYWFCWAIDLYLNTKYLSCYIFTIPPSKTQLSVNSYSLYFQMAQDSLQCAGQICDPLLGLSEGRDPGSAAGGKRWSQHRRRHCVWDPAAGRGCIWGRTLSKCLSLWKHIIKCFPLEPCSYLKNPVSCFF